MLTKILFLHFFILLSCSKDTDLLVDAVLQSDNPNITEHYALDDFFKIEPNSNITLDVLSNDSFIDENKVKITETSSPINGIVIINENKTLTYISNQIPIVETPQEESISDTFTYTVEALNEDETTTSSTAIVTVTIAEDNSTTIELSKSIQLLKVSYDSVWTGSINEKSRYITISENGDQGDLYYFDDGIRSLITMFQVTGEKTYLDEAISLSKKIISKAKISSELPQKNGYNDSYLSWYSSINNSLTGQGLENGGQASLYEGRGFRHIAKMLWIMHESPSLLNSSNYNEDYNEILAFITKHIWEKWENRDNGAMTHFYRRTVDPTANWAYIGLYLNKITGDEKYKEVFYRFNSDMSLSPAHQTSSMRENIRPNSKNPSAYMWKRHWDNSDSHIADHSHENRAVSLMVDAYELGEYWTLSDMIALRKTIDVFWDPKTDGSVMKEYIDGTNSSSPDTRPYIEWGWMMLGRFDNSLQKQLEKRNLKQAKSGRLLHLHFAQLAYNLSVKNNLLFYPEN
ncbi:hypothetical protein CLV91_3163 [Maribacter vaceletii]|uniref:Uncharacterized protein n=1 Tax=Maribacter vaceletii TaxID=1206816 RepID=A0A495DT48_9FLAO|nr:Ig-like domain-containing protein [Maribacter vaceletii]RKR07177.1 hypothetical protein CLV91_3163 [Maribacter vaceletii]